jgi:alpha-galactosidase/6-phospho-beta-glucosidase family protein
VQQVDKWRAVVIMVMNHLVPQKEGISALVEELLAAKDGL